MFITGQHENYNVGDTILVMLGGAAMPTGVVCESITFEIIKETEKAVMVKPEGAEQKDSFWLPKKAIVRKLLQAYYKATKVKEYEWTIAHWFKMNYFQEQIIEKHLRFSGINA